VGSDGFSTAVEMRGKVKIPTLAGNKTARIGHPKKKTKSKSIRRD
jgi:hypothetical protein